MTDEEPAPLPSGAYIAGFLLLAIFGFIIWLVANYPNNPTERPRTDNCESIAEPNHQTDYKQYTATNDPTRVNDNETAPPNSPRDDADEKHKIDGQIAKYNCQLAVYTRDLANFTRWLVYATTGLIIIGVLQGYFLQKSVRVADRAATEAKDAIIAAHGTQGIVSDVEIVESFVSARFT